MDGAGVAEVLEKSEAAKNSDIARGDVAKVARSAGAGIVVGNGLAVAIVVTVTVSAATAAAVTVCRRCF